ncbi:MAG: ChrB protein [Anaerolinea sp.]|nr:ChrB protein [Anaerolinea sp.]
MRWLLLIYKVPNEPSARRVYVWRKLKGMGALLLQDSAWVLPTTPQTREKLMWLTAEIKEMEGGSATLWEADAAFTGQEDSLVQQFTAQVDELYREIMTQLEQTEVDIAALSKRYQHAQTRDYFQSAFGQQVRDALLRRRGDDS